MIEIMIAHYYEDETKIKDVKSIIDDIIFERLRQDKKWGQQHHSPAQWLSVLMEEVGETAEIVNQSFETEIPFNASNYRNELIQVAAVAVAAVECLAGKEPQ